MEDMKKSAVLVILSLFSLSAPALSAEPLSEFKSAQEDHRRDGKLYSQSARAFAFYERGLQALKTKKPQEAVEAFTKALRVYPAYAEAFY